MGFVRTRYEDSDNNNIKFDQSTFDFTETEDAFPADVTNDVENILLEIGRIYKNINPSETGDGRGRITAVDETDFFYTYASLQDITLRDRQLQDMGVMNAGTKKGFFKKFYTTTNEGVDINRYVKEGNIIVDENGDRWRITKVLGEKGFSDEKSMVVCVLQSISNSGTSA